MSTMRESSTKHWTSADSIEHINTGSLQRIADACELMAKNYPQLQADRDLYKRWYENARKDLEREKRLRAREAQKRIPARRHHSDEAEGRIVSDTPLTDAAMCVLHPGVQPSTWYVQAEKCREIERALAAERSAHEATMAELEACRADMERLQKQIDAISEMNHGQFLQLEFLRKVYEAAHELYCESEEYDFDDGLGKGAPQQYWDALADAFEPETDAIKDEIDAAMKEPSDAG